MVAVKQGWKTTEFWVNIVAQLAGLFTLLTGLNVSAQAEGAVRGVGGAIMALTALGYAISRGLTKKGALSGASLVNNSQV